MIFINTLKEIAMIRNEGLTLIRGMQDFCHSGWRNENDELFGKIIETLEENSVDVDVKLLRQTREIVPDLQKVRWNMMTADEWHKKYLFFFDHVLNPLFNVIDEDDDTFREMFPFQRVGTDEEVEEFFRIIKETV